MNCIICNSKSQYYFSKQYSEPPFDDFMRDIGKVDYYKCQGCGFVLSKTHSDLDEARWSELNIHFHKFHEKSGSYREINQPPYAEQALMISILGKNGIIDTESMIDYAAGYGRLSTLLSKYFKLSLPLYDPYVQTNDSERYVSKKDLKVYKTVINSAMFEHVLNREALDQVNDIVEPKGCLIIHTVVCENIPKDPNWFYLQPPVHKAFHTNKSMEILMNQWGYNASIYSPKSKSWVFIRDNSLDIENKILKINDELQDNWFYFKNGFVDYWKGF